MGHSRTKQALHRPTLLEQLARMSSKHPQLRRNLEGLRRQTISWEGPWIADDLGTTYEMRLVYKFGKRPVISILHPKLAMAKGLNKLPHTYADGQMDICVHRLEEWHPSLLIADSIMPWISQWLYFYEIWSQTGAWLGKGTHPDLAQHKEAA